MAQDLILLALEEISEEDLDETLIQELLSYREGSVIRPIKSGRLNVEGMTEEECWHYFRFRKDDLECLRQNLGIPSQIIAERRKRISGLEALCLLLRRLAYPNRLADLEPMFGLSKPYLSSICNELMGFLVNRHGRLLSHLQNLLWLNESRLHTYAQAIANKGAPLQNCWGFIDGTARAICRPTHDQDNFYSGHKRMHCVKYQSILAPDGIIVSLHGAYPGRRHDAGMFRESNIYQQLEACAVHGRKKYVLYGDPAYPITELVLCPHPSRNATLQQLQFNKFMSSVRQAVEWGFGKVVREFAFLDFKKKQKIQLQEIIAMYKIAVLLTNCHTCMYGSQASSFFNVEPPSLEEYLG